MSGRIKADDRKEKTMRRITAILLIMVLLGMIPAAHAGKEGPMKYESHFETVAFGRYEQDNNPDNGPEPIQWIVLEEQDGKRLLYAKDLLDKHRYNETYGSITWAESDLRAWLNNEFLQAAFTEEEQAAILLTDVDNSAAQCHPKYQATGGADTRDKIFLISYAEAAKYFEDNESRRAAPTDYAIAQGVKANNYYEIDGRKCGMWWLRSPGEKQYRVSMSYFSGILNYSYATKDVVGIRPMLWVDTGLLSEGKEE